MRELLALLADDRVPLDRAAALLASLAEPGVDVDALLGDLDRLASSTPDGSPEEFMSALFGPGGFTGNVADYYDPANSLLTQVMKRRTGIPITLSLIAMELGRRVGLTVHGIGMPGHFIVREADSGRYYDPFHGPAALDLQGCAALYRSVHGSHAPFHVGLLSPITASAIIDRMVANLAVAYRRRGDRRNLAWVLAIQSERPGAGADLHRARAQLEASLGRFDEAARAMHHAATLSGNARDLRESEAFAARLN